jgi:uncharacterized damage-inducible protein DinB
MESVFKVLQKSREAIYHYAKEMPLEKLNQIPQGFNNNIIWNLGHIVAVQQLLVYGLSKTPFAVDQFIIDHFKNKTKPERDYTREEVDRVLSSLETSTVQMQKDYNDKKFGVPTAFISKSLNTTFDTIEEIITFNIFHEGLHTGIIQKYAQLLQ